MRARLIALSLSAVLGFSGALAIGSSAALAADKIPGGVKKKVESLVAELVGGKVDSSDSQKREKIFNDLDAALTGDKKSVAIRTPGFWVESITSSYFSDRGSARHKKLVTETMEGVGPFPDGSLAKVDIAFWGAAAYNSGTAHPLLLCVVSDGQDLKPYIENNWLVHESIKKGWIVAAVAESDKFPIGRHPWMSGFAFVHMRSRFNIDPNRVFLVSDSGSSDTVQKVATAAIPDRIAGLVLINPTKPLTSKNTSLYSAVVVHAGSDDPTAKAYLELDPGRNRAIPSDDMAMPAVVTWLEAHTGRVLPSTYSWETETTEEGTTMPWTGSVWIESPQKRGEPVSLAVTYDRETNSVAIEAENLGEFIVYMNDELLDLDAPVTISVNGEALVTEKKFERQVRTLFRIADTYGEYGRVFTAEWRGFAPTPAAAPEEGAEGGDGEKKDGE